MVTLNNEQQLYVIPAGDGYSCLGYDITYQKATTIADWLISNRINVLRPDRQNIGTLQGYEEYSQLCRTASDYSQTSGKRCLAELHPQLIPFERKRIEVTTKDGNKRRFYVGKSTGWMPCHLEIKKASSSGGFAIDHNEEFTMIRIIK